MGRHDGFNGREVGAKLAHALLRVLDPVNGDMVAAGANPRPGKGGVSTTSGGGGGGGMESLFEGLDQEESSPDILPEFYMPIAKGGFLPGNLHFYRITSARTTTRPIGRRCGRIRSLSRTHWTLTMARGTSAG